MVKKRMHAKMLLAMFMTLLLVLAACGGSDTGSDDKETETETGFKKPEPDENGAYSLEDFNSTKTNLGEAIDGGTLQFGLVSDTAFEGLLNFNFYQGNPDAQILGWFDESLLAVDENFAYTQEGAATFEVDEENQKITLTIKDGVNWHDGNPVTAEDWLFSYEVIAHPDYDGIRYGGDFTIIEGVEAYKAGEADTISGIEVHDEKSMTITYNTFSPSLLASGIWSYAMPKHIFEEIPVADMSSSDPVRRNPIGMGAFKVEEIQPGEFVTFVKNEDYWRGEPKLDGVNLKVVNPTVVVQALESGELDLVDAFPTAQYADNADLTNVEYLADVDRAYSYIGFKLGKWDNEINEVAPDENMKMADVNLRRAMWHAVDNDAVGREFYNGFRWNGTVLIPPNHPLYHDDSIETPKYDVAEANRILDEAGYIDVNDDGFREDKEGNELIINFASMSGDDTAEPMAQYYIQSWGEVGLNVQLVEGRLMEFNSFYERVGADDPVIDIYAGAWAVGSDVNPENLYGRLAAFNYPRFASEENDRLIAAGISKEAFDQSYRQEVYSEWQQYMVDEIPVFPTLYRSKMIPVNNRVVNYQITYDPENKLYRNDIGVTQEEPIVE